MREAWLGSIESSQEYSRLLGWLEATHGSSQVNLHCGEDENPVGFEYLEGGLGIISFSGSTISRTTGWSRYYNMVSYDDIRERFAEAADDQRVKLILFRPESSGGAEAGVKALSTFIAQVDQKVKPVITFTQDLMCSAALWYGTAGSAVLAEEGARVGSLGALLVHLSYVDALKMNGVTPTVFRSAPLKALGSPYEELSTLAKKEIQEELMDLHMSFVTGVSQNTGLSIGHVASKIATGKVFKAAEAKTLGLVTSISTYDQAVATALQVINTMPQTQGG